MMTRGHAPRRTGCTARFVVLEGFVRCSLPAAAAGLAAFFVVGARFLRTVDAAAVLRLRTVPFARAGVLLRAGVFLRRVVIRGLALQPRWPR